ncbi:hypothetical protein, partial [Rhizobium leguminosarum]|uniref:hypothetical protein n=1 Tax=Rhizobium leguminosarum TaxID=384 RepID=UPI003F9B9480
LQDTATYSVIGSYPWILSPVGLEHAVFDLEIHRHIAGVDDRRVRTAIMVVADGWGERIEQCKSHIHHLNKDRPRRAISRRAH